jgi:hypothetical protein
MSCPCQRCSLAKTPDFGPEVLVAKGLSIFAKEIANLAKTLLLAETPDQSFRSPCRLRRWMVLCLRSCTARMYRIVRLRARIRMECVIAF